MPLCSQPIIFSVDKSWQSKERHSEQLEFFGRKNGSIFNIIYFP